MTLSATSRDDFTAAIDLFDSCVGATAADAWNRPSPCEGWAASDVLAHCVANLRALQGAATGRDFVETAAEAVDGDLVEAWSAAAVEAKECVTSERLDTVVVAGREAPAVVLVDGLMRDLVIHTWDIAEATGTATPIPDALISAATTAMAMVGPNARRPGMYGQEVTPPATADALTRLLALSGRQNW